jgi:hypothetical protein
LEALAKAGNPRCSFRPRLFQFHGSRRICGFGDAEVFSFHAPKFFNTFEGRAIPSMTTPSPPSGHMRNFGFAGYDQVARLGTTARCRIFPPAMGLCLMGQTRALLVTNAATTAPTAKRSPACPALPCLRWTSRKPFQLPVRRRRTVAELPAFARDLLSSPLWAEKSSSEIFHPGCHRAEAVRRTRARARPAGHRRLVPPGRGVPDGHAVHRADPADSRKPSVSFVHADDVHAA